VRQALLRHTPLSLRNVQRLQRAAQEIICTTDLITADEIPPPAPEESD
jgi:hypothetical protein